MLVRLSQVVSLIVALAYSSPIAAEQNARLRGRIVDANSGKPLPARLYIQGSNGKWHFPKPAAKEGTAVYYKKHRPGAPGCVEMHTTLSAHPFTIDLPPGEYTLTAERGHEYFTSVRKITVAKKPQQVTLKLKRWINLAERGWYSGETHVHRPLAELPNIMLAEDLNVAFPLVWWVTKAFAPPRTGRRSAKKPPPAKVIEIDKTHLIWPRNTEYEIFTVGKKRHTLGAFFVINHKSIFERGVPPVGKVAKQAHAEKALLELDKPNWPWSMMLVPIMKIDLYELSNNHIWRTKFAFERFGVAPPRFMKVAKGLNGFFSEEGWIEFNFKNYYTLLNCGFRLRPTAGTASGVHPVPLGFGRVYVYCGKKLDLNTWTGGLNQGRSFATTGPMLFTKINGKLPGQNFEQREKTKSYTLSTTALSSHPLDRIEVIINGDVARRIKPQNHKLKSGAFATRTKANFEIAGTSWIAVRVFEKRPDGRPRFAHSAPVHIDVAGNPLRPKRAEIGFLIKRVEDELKRHQGVLPKSALAEYERGLAIYRRIAKTAR